MKNLINWHEGLFLEPQHLQLQQKSIIDAFAEQNKNLFTYSYGILESQINRQLLEEGTVSFEKLKLVMKSGTYIDIKENVNMSMLDINNSFSERINELTVYICLPYWEETKENIYFENQDKILRDKTRYIASEIDFSDENNGRNTRTISTKKNSCFLSVEEENIVNCEKIPVLKLKKSGKSGKIEVEDTFIPSCILLYGNDTLNKLVRDFFTRLRISAKDHLEELLYSQVFYNETPRIIKPIMKSHILNRYCAGLGTLLDKPRISPFELFTELKTLYAELCTLTADLSFLSDIKYNHEMLYDTFTLLISRIDQKILFVEKLKSYNVNQFVYDSHDELLKVSLDENIIKNSIGFVIGITTKLATGELVKIIEEGEKFKVLSPKTSRGGAIPGLKMSFYQDVTGIQLPQKAGVSYFKINISEEEQLWAAVVEEKELAIVCKNEYIEKFKIELFSLLQEKGEVKYESD